MSTPDPATTPIAVAPPAVVASSAATRSAVAVIAVVVGALVAIALVAAVGGFSSPSSPSSSSSAPTTASLPGPYNPADAVDYYCPRVATTWPTGYLGVSTYSGQPMYSVPWRDTSGRNYTALTERKANGEYLVVCAFLQAN